MRGVRAQRVVAQTQKKEGTQRVGGGAKGGEPKISRFFSLSRSHVRSFSLSGVFSVSFFISLGSIRGIVVGF